MKTESNFVIKVFCLWANLLYWSSRILFSANILLLIQIFFLILFLSLFLRRSSKRYFLFIIDIWLKWFNLFILSFYKCIFLNLFGWSLLNKLLNFFLLRLQIICILLLFVFYVFLYFLFRRNFLFIINDILLNFLSYRWYRYLLIYKWFSLWVNYKRSI